MPSTITDRLNGLTTSVAIKAPCRVATTTNITLSGLQTIDGVALAAGDRVLVKNQTTTSQNGIYAANSGAWARTADFDGSLDVVKGTIIPVHSGTVGAGGFWKVATADPIVIGTSSIGFQASVIATENIITPELFGAVGDGTTNDQPAMQAALDYAVANGIRTIYYPADCYAVWIPQRTSAAVPIYTAIHSYDGMGLVQPPGTHIRHIGLSTKFEGRTKWKFLNYQGLEFGSNYQVVGGGVWRGIGYLLKGFATASVPANFDDRGSVWFENLLLDGTHPRQSTNAAPTTFPADISNGTGWDETSKPFSAENDRHVGDMYFVNYKATRWGGEMLYVAGKSSQSLSDKRDPLCYLRRCEFTNGDGSGINPSAVDMDADGVLVDNVNLAAEGWIGRTGKLINAEFRNCYWSGAIAGGKINDTGVGTSVFDPTRTISTEVPQGLFDIIVRNCVQPWQFGSWSRGRICAVDTQVVFGNNPPFDDGSYDHDMDVELVLDQTTRATCTIMGAGGANGAMLTDNINLRVK